MIKRIAAMFLIILFVFTNLALPGDNPASTGLSFLKIGVGSRAVGMGGAFTGLADDPSATYWNPAGLARIEGANLLFSHNEWLQDISNEFVAVNFSAGKNAFGVSLMNNNVGGIERRVEATEDPLGEVDAHDVMLGLSYARMLSQRLSLGATVKFIYEKIYIEESSGMAVDVGVLYQSTIEGLNAGLSLQNFGFISELKEEAVNLPQTVRAGVAYLLPFLVVRGKIILAADFVQVFESTSHLNMGFEYNLKDFFALRLGYQTGYDDKGFHTGFGVKYSRYRFDYAFVPFTSDLGNSHRISFGLGL